MGAEARIVFYTDDPAAAPEAARAVLARISDIESELSDWRVGGAVQCLREAKPGVRYDVSPELAEALEISLRVGAQTAGAFDPACGRMTQAWRQQRDSGGHPATWEPWIAAHGAPSSRLRLADGQVSFGSPLPWFDFGGVGKGMAADEGLEVLKQLGLECALVDLGGDIAIGHPPPGHRGWRVRRGRGQPIWRSHCGVATSGSGPQHVVTMDGVASHVFDPRSGRWMGRHGDITVVAPTAAEADALASAGCVLGGSALRERLRGVAGVQVLTDHNRQD